MQRYILDQGFIGDDHSGGVGAGVAHHALHLGGGVNQVAQVRGRFVKFLEFRDFFQGFEKAERLAGDVGDQFGDFVHLAERDVHHPSNIANGGAGAQGAKGDDLGDLILAILAGGIFHHFGTAIVAKVQVNIRHGDAPWVEKTLED